MPYHVDALQPVILFWRVSNSLSFWRQEKLSLFFGQLYCNCKDTEDAWRRNFKVEKNQLRKRKGAFCVLAEDNKEGLEVSLIAKS